LWISTWADDSNDWPGRGIDDDINEQPGLKRKFQVSPPAVGRIWKSWQRSVVLAAGNGRYDCTAGDAAGTSITQALTVPASTSSSTVTTTNTATSTTTVTTTVDTVDAITSISFDMAWQNADVGGANDNRIIVSYNGVVYATFETFEGIPPNGAGLVGNWTYSNGATGPATTLSVANEATGAMTSITINLPPGVTASGLLQFRYTTGSTGAGSDDLAVDNVVATSTKTTTTTVTTVTRQLTTDNSGHDHTENGPSSRSPIPTVDLRQ
jgi:hypothetical protein